MSRIAFVIGAARSGTTLFRVMLAGHPRLFSPPEMVLAPFETMAEREAHMSQRYWEKGGLRRALMDLTGMGVDEAKAAVDALGDRAIPEVYARLLELSGERILVDKCPHLAMLGRPGLERVARWFPDARYVWLVRHPGSVIRSAASMPMAEVMLKGVDGDVAHFWRLANEACRDFLAEVPRERWLRVHYEELVREPEATMRAVCALLDVPFDAKVLEPYEGDRMREGPKGARAIGDSNMVARGKIDPSLATSWLAGWDPRSVPNEVITLARELGYSIDLEARTPLAELSSELGAFLDAVRELERGIDLPSDLDAIEGRRFLLRMMSASLDTFLEHADVERPRFHHSEGPTRKMFADCPDTDYLRAPIRMAPGRVYRVWGRIPEGTTYVGVLLYGKGGRVGNRLSDEALSIDADGRFELRVAMEEQPGTWLRADGDETAVMVRQYFVDRGRQPPIEVHVELEAPAPAPQRTLEAPAMSDGLRRASRMVKTIFDRTIGAYHMATKAGLNRFFEIGGEALFPTPDNLYQVTWYRFAPGQLLLVRGRLPEARYYSFAVYDAWMESLDYERHPRCSLNHEQLVTDAEGRFEVCLAAEDPGHPNWIDVAGHHAGYVLVRSLLPKGALPPLETQVLFVSEWKGSQASAAVPA